MESKSQFKLSVTQEVVYPQPAKREEIPDIDLLRIAAAAEGFNACFYEVMAGLERTDSFLQRISVINNEIERQLIIKTAK